MISRGGIAVLVSATLAMGGCSLLPGSAPAYTHISKDLPAALPQTEGFAGLEVYTDRFALLSMRESEPTYQIIFPKGRDPQSVPFKVATVPPDQVDAVKLQQQAKELAEVCQTAAYQVSFAVISRTATMSKVRCGPDEQSLVGAEGTQARINDEQIPTLTSDPDERFWNDLLGELRVLAPSGTVQNVVIEPKRVSVWLAATDATGNCQPVVQQTRDGRSISMVCYNTRPKSSVVDLSKLTGAALAEATAAAIKQGNIAAPDTYRLDVDGSQIILGVTGGGTGAATVPVG